MHLPAFWVSFCTMYTAMYHCHLCWSNSAGINLEILKFGTFTDFLTENCLKWLLSSISQTNVCPVIGVVNTATNGSTNKAVQLVGPTERCSQSGFPALNVHFGFSSQKSSTQIGWCLPIIDRWSTNSIVGDHVPMWTNFPEPILGHPNHECWIYQCLLWAGVGL